MFSSLSSLPQPGRTNLALLCKQVLGCEEMGFSGIKCCRIIISFVIILIPVWFNTRAGNFTDLCQGSWVSRRTSMALLPALELPHPSHGPAPVSIPHRFGDLRLPPLPMPSQPSCSYPGKGQKHPGETIPLLPSANGSSGAFNC